ncbi:TonB-dependent receptor plug domain-containing protein [Thiovibrio frasassiensis]|uniref:TonB-dependent receptor n=1 Tax=Thiovibrio frasassiensis TaxID=2984131 RepID=A0A9X4RMH0_9BACT|nr:TonB-dependent receptor [Thiovibrio frasassiensis]MDG4477081.1 TonB-dependent receptor [Thiovibrio frasassiensis]
MQKIYVITAALVLGATMAARAEETATRLEELVITATRTPATVAQVGGSSVTVITAQEIEAKQQLTVEEVLKSAPGLNVVANGGLGTNTSVFIRGADAKNTLVLVDGIMFNDPSEANRGANLANLTTDNIERIEIVRGPMSVLFGSNATAGVINIITKKGKGRPGYYLGGEAGSHGTWKSYAGSSGAVERFNYALSLSRTEAQGFSTADDKNDRIPHAHGTTSEKDGWRNTTFSGKAGYLLTPDCDISALARSMNSRVDLDSTVSGYLQDNKIGSPQEKYIDSKELLSKFNVHNRFMDGELDANLYYQHTGKERIIINDSGRSLYNGDSSEVGWQGTVTPVTANTVTLGLSYFAEEMDSSGGFIVIDKQTATVTSSWLQDQISLGERANVVVGARIDDHDRFGSAETYRVAPSYLFAATGTTLKGAYGTGFRAPSLFELYAPGYGDSTLEAEKSTGWDAGVEQELPGERLTVGITYFQARFDNLIQFDTTTWKYSQATGESTTRGVESFARFSPSTALEVTLAYTYTDTEDAGGVRLTRRPLSKGSLSTSYRFSEKLRTNAELLWVGERDENGTAKDKDGNRVSTLAPYTVVNLAGSYALTASLDVYGRIDNLFNEQYEEAWSYATPGLSCYGGLKYHF